MIGPFAQKRIVLCSADAGPRCQRQEPGSAGYFYPGAKWVGTIRNAAERLGCRFVILTTGHGLVTPEQTIFPYDLPYSDERNAQRIEEIWKKTIPQVLGSGLYDIFLIYFGGCPRDPAFAFLKDILSSMNISLMTFGRPNMFDIGRIDKIIDRLINGTSTDQIRSLLKLPERFQFIPAVKAGQRAEGKSV